MKGIRFLFSLLFCLAHLAAARTLIVGDGEEFSSLRQAIGEARPFDTVLIREGLYFEHSLRVDKPLTLIGSGDAVVDARGEAVDIFLIASDSVSLSGLTLQNVGVSFMKEIAAVKVRNVKEVRISENRVINCFFGIYLEYARNCTVEKNELTGHTTNEASAGNAIHAWKCEKLHIAGNLATGHRDGIYFEFVDDSSIRGNRSVHNLRYGLHFMFSNRDQYVGNEFRDNGSGVAVMFSRDILMSGNTFIENQGGASYGLLLKEISDGAIEGNRFQENTVAILAEGANRLKIAGNDLRSNGIGINVKGNCLGNTIERNNFVANTFEVVTNSKFSNNRFEANYWSGYRGYDLDRDGFGDEGYRPVSLLAKLIEAIPAASILVNSVFANFLELSEKIIPQLIPAELMDETPRMTPYAHD